LIHICMCLKDLTLIVSFSTISKSPDKQHESFQFAIGEQVCAGLLDSLRGLGGG
jgi:hypothetical protein